MNVNGFGVSHHGASESVVEPEPSPGRLPPFASPPELPKKAHPIFKLLRFNGFASRPPRRTRLAPRTSYFAQITGRVAGNWQTRCFPAPMLTPGFVSLSTDFLDAPSAVTGTENIITAASGGETLFEDDFWYSPVLPRRLNVASSALLLLIRHPNSGIEPLSLLSLAAFTRAFQIVYHDSDRSSRLLLPCVSA